MFWKVLTTLSLVWCVRAHPTHATSEQRFIQYFKDEPKIIYVRSEKSENQEKYVDAYPFYEFSYKISDPHTHDYKGQEEKRDGDKVNGDYWLVEPDGRKRVVKYHANDKIGFNVLVDYLQEKHYYPSQLKDQESSENKSEEINKDEEEVKSKNEIVNQNSQENSKKIEDEKENSVPVISKQSSAETDSDNSQDKAENEVVNNKVQKKWKHRPLNRRITNKKNGGDKVTESRENAVLKNNESANDKRKEMDRRKQPLVPIKQEKKTGKATENQSESKSNGSNQRHRHKDEKINKGYEVYEEINENSSENNTESKSSQSEQPEADENSTDKEIITSGSNEKSENETNNKSSSNEKKDNKEEIYGYNTFIYHKRHH